VAAFALLAEALALANVSVFLALVLAASAAFLRFEALQGWCLQRACGIKTRFWALGAVALSVKRNVQSHVCRIQSDARIHNPR
jgi:hypothetical protein